jgi:hypothetical protein
LHHDSLTGIRQVVVIPLCAEYPGFLQTLQDLAACDSGAREATLVLLVVNNRTPASADAEDVANNLRTLAAIEDGGVPEGLRLAWVDAARPGSELPPKDGVGLARKIGMDWALEVLVDANGGAGGIICLDGDTRVDADYLGRFDAYFQSGRRWGAVTEYAHPVDGDDAETRAILCYEIFLRYQALSLAWAGSPFAYHTIGSAMACTAEAYAACGGMRRKQAGEDFYFLQALGKTGSVDYLKDIVVRPASRPSHRVPFGTGKRVRRYLAGTHDEYRLYHPESFRILREWFSMAGEDLDGVELVARGAEIESALGGFLEAEKFPEAWDRVRAQHKTTAARRRQFFLWCDGLRTLRILHYMRDTVYPDAEMFSAVGELLARLNAREVWSGGVAVREDLAGQRDLLGVLRRLESERLGSGGL